MLDKSVIAVPTASASGVKTAGTPLLICQLADRFVAISTEDVARITPMAELACPPGLPSMLEGVLNLADVAIPVLRLDRLLNLPAQRLGLYSMLVILRISAEGRLAILVDRVREIVTVPDSAFLPINKDDSFNGCTQAAISIGEEIIPVLSSSRMLLAKEREALAEFQVISRRRLQEWEVRP